MYSNTMQLKLYNILCFFSLRQSDHSWQNPCSFQPSIALVTSHRQAPRTRVIMSGVKSGSAKAFSLARRSIPFTLAKSARQACSSDVMFGIGEEGGAVMYRGQVGVTVALATLGCGARWLRRGIMATMSIAVISVDPEGEWLVRIPGPAHPLGFTLVKWPSWTPSNSTVLGGSCFVALAAA